MFTEKNKETLFQFTRHLQFFGKKYTKCNKHTFFHWTVPNVCAQIHVKSTKVCKKTRERGNLKWSFLTNNLKNLITICDGKFSEKLTRSPVNELQEKSKDFRHFSLQRKKQTNNAKKWFPFENVHSHKHCRCKLTSFPSLTNQHYRMIHWGKKQRLRLNFLSVLWLHWCHFPAFVTKQNHCMIRWDVKQHLDFLTVLWLHWCHFPLLVSNTSCFLHWGRWNQLKKCQKKSQVIFFLSTCEQTEAVSK